MWVTEIVVGPRADHKHPRSSSSTVLEAFSTVWAVPHIISTHLGMGINIKYKMFFRPTLALSSGERRHESRSLSVPDSGADHTQTHDSRQIRAVTIAYHTDHENVRNS